MSYTFARNPVVIDKNKNKPGINASDLTKTRRINTFGSFVTTNGVLGSVKKAMQAAKANGYGNDGNFITESKLMRSSTPFVPPPPPPPPSAFENVTFSFPQNTTQTVLIDWTGGIPANTTTFSLYESTTTPVTTSNTMIYTGVPTSGIYISLPQGTLKSTKYYAVVLTAQNDNGSVSSSITQTIQYTTYMLQPTGNIKSWVGLSYSLSGQDLLGITPTNFYISTDNGQIFAESSETSTGWITCVVAGPNFFAVESNGSVLVSRNSGGTYTRYESALVGHTSGKIVSSTIGDILFEIDTSQQNNNNISMSTDYGETWSNISSAGSHKWKDIAVSQDCAKIYAIASDLTEIQYSSDGGTTFTYLGSGIVPSGLTWDTISCSSTGKYIFATELNGAWKSTEVDAPFAHVRSIPYTNQSLLTLVSYEGQTFYAIDAVTKIVYRSPDAGSTWSVVTGATVPQWSSITCTEDGKLLALSVNGGDVYTATFA